MSDHLEQIEYMSFPTHYSGPPPESEPRNSPCHRVVDTYSAAASANWKRFDLSDGKKVTVS